MRNAAEDFYLLNKVRKVGRVVTLGGDPIVLSSRGSDRVPFGTGRAVLDWDGDARLYDPRCFDVVRRAREALLADAVDGWLAWGHEQFGRDFEDAVAPLELAVASKRASAETRSDEARTKHVDGYFDAFAQRKLVHRMRDACLPSPSLPDALRDAPFVDVPSDPIDALHALRRAEISESRSRSTP